MIFVTPDKRLFTNERDAEAEAEPDTEPNERDAEAEPDGEPGTVRPYPKTLR